MYFVSFLKLVFFKLLVAEVVTRVSLDANHQLSYMQLYHCLHINNIQTALHLLASP